MKPDDALKVSPEEKRAHEAVDDALYGDGTKENAHAAITAAVRAAEERGKRQVTQDVVDHEARCAVKLAEERMRERCAEEADDEGLVVLAANIRALPLTGDSGLTPSDMVKPSTGGRVI